MPLLRTSDWLLATTGVLLLAGLLNPAPAHAAKLNLYLTKNEGPIAFAATEIETAAAERGHRIARTTVATFSARAGMSIVLTSMDDELALRTLQNETTSRLPSPEEEGFSIRITGEGESKVVWVVGHDAGGAMYGGLELAEQLRVKELNAIEPMDRNPYMSMRGTKFNVPLDVRTPSYSDMSDAAQANIAEVWSIAFWEDYLDNLARHRFNYVSLWNLHPFPSMVKVPKYPDVALADVKRSKIAFKEDYPTIATDFVTQEMLANTETLKKMSIEDKVDFWRRVMQHAKDRNIDFYVVTWNIYTYGVDGKYGITDSIGNQRTIDYFRSSVREMFRTYPLLRGIGLTTGENMGEEEFQAKEDWAFATYGQGVLDVARAEPNRQIRFIHRQHQTRAQDIARTFAPLLEQSNVDFIFSFKYAQAHALSSTTQTFHRGYLESLGDLKTIWTLRNDDALMFRWGAPDFVREFIKNIPHEPSKGFYFGSDMWVWGREFLSRDNHRPRPLEIEKHWYHWMLWGRLGYDPSLDNERLVAMLAHRYPELSAKTLFDAWQHASMIYPLTTGFHWADFDFQWYIEGCRSRPGPAQTASGFHDVNRFITLGTHPGTDNVSIPGYVEALVSKQEPNGTTPFEVAQQIDEHATSALTKLREMRASKSGNTVSKAAASNDRADTLEDIRAMALLGKYYASKIRGATELALYRTIGAAEHQQRAIAHLTSAQRSWHEYTAATAARYRNPLWTNRVGFVDWKELDAEVEKDVEIARRSQACGSVLCTPIEAPSLNAQ